MTQELYLSDLQALERARMIRKGSFVAADNVVVFAMTAYREYIQQLATAGVVETQLHMGHLEYVRTDMESEQHWKDGMECTIYLKDPPT